MDTMKKFCDAKARIWGSESHACSIVFQPMANKYFAECDSSMETRRLTEKNYLEVLNDMFYNYCIENAAYMEVS